MKVPESVDLETMTDDKIVDVLMRDAGYSEGAARYVMKAFRGRVSDDLTFD